MPLRWFDSVEELGKHIVGSSKNELVSRDAAEVVAELGKEVLRARIEQNIYGHYTPRTGAWIGGTTYHARHDLADNVTAEIKPDGTILITTNAHVHGPIVRGAMFNDHGDPGGSFLKLLESGNLGIWRNGFPRRAVPIAQADVESSAFWNRVNSRLEMAGK